jgi:hypothetical protein
MEMNGELHVPAAITRDRATGEGEGKGKAVPVLKQQSMNMCEGLEEEFHVVFTSIIETDKRSALQTVPTV